MAPGFYKWPLYPANHPGTSGTTKKEIILSYIKYIDILKKKQLLKINQLFLVPPKATLIGLYIDN